MFLYLTSHPIPISLYDVCCETSATLVTPKLHFYFVFVDADGKLIIEMCH